MCKVRRVWWLSGHTLYNFPDELERGWLIKGPLLCPAFGNFYQTSVNSSNDSILFAHFGWGGGATEFPELGLCQDTIKVKLKRYHNKVHLVVTFQRLRDNE